ncbi:TPA: YbbR-like domain-containing protein [Streptococcus suis]|uniref:CdaR family protein n=1 Tax=Streptococcus parasuis TaxID=1501662 RepID=UPI00289F0A3B|nr:CdaR family protein [Streptococcus parasuis]
MNKKFRTVGHLTLSIFLALLLFFYATTTNYKNSESSASNNESETYVHTLSGVPIDIEYDTNKYFISGFSSTVAVELRGSNRVLLQRESDESTRTFQVIADLRELTDGTQTVTLQLANLPPGVSATLAPDAITVKIGKKVSQSLAVEGVIYSNQLASGYSVSKVTVDVSSVKVTTDEETMAKIDHVEAVAVDISNLDSNYSGTAKLQAVDSDGNALPVVLSETEANIQVVVTQTK